MDKPYTFISKILPALSAAMLVFSACSRQGDSAPLDPQSYLPLAPGNRWTYQRTVAPDKKVFCYADQVLVLPNGKKAIFFTVNAVTDLSTRSTETYSVTGRAGASEIWGGDFWSVAVDGQKARDGRFVAFAKGRYSSSEAKTIKWGYAGDCLIEQMEGISTQTQDDRKAAFGRIMGLLAPDTHVDQERGDGKPQEWVVNTLKRTTTVTVPAGTFNNCLECVTTVRIDGATEFASLSKVTAEEKEAFGKFTTTAYFAPHIGLVKEIQTDSHGKEVYRLELESYSVRK